MTLDFFSSFKYIAKNNRDFNGKKTEHTTVKTVNLYS